MIRCTILALCGFTAALAAQQGGPRFEVASIRPHTSDDQRVTMVMQPGGRLVATNIPLRHVIRTAFQVQDDQIVGAPGWVDTDRFDINATAAGEVRLEHFAPLLQGLLADRFALATHREMRELPVFALERLRGDGPPGDGLRPTACPAIEIDLQQATPCANISNGVNFLSLRGMPIAQFAQYLSPYVNRIVVDRTGLDGRYDIVLKWSPETAAGAGAAPVPAAIPDRPYLLTALQEQLGLRLAARRATVEVLVIDSVAHPTPN